MGFPINVYNWEWPLDVDSRIGEVLVQTLPLHVLPLILGMLWYLYLNSLRVDRVCEQKVERPLVIDSVDCIPHSTKMRTNCRDNSLNLCCFYSFVSIFQRGFSLPKGRDRCVFRTLDVTHLAKYNWNIHQAELLLTNANLCEHTHSLSIENALTETVNSLWNE